LQEAFGLETPDRSAPADGTHPESYASVMSVDRPEQLEGLRRAGGVVAATLRALRAMIAPGVTTGQLGELARHVFAEHGRGRVRS
jgi:hypothetical protein